MKGNQLIEEGKLSLNLAKIKKGGERFEIVIDPDAAIRYTQGEEMPVSEVLRSQEIFADAQKGEHASETVMNNVFKTKDALKIAEVILKEGEIQFTAEYRDDLREKKRKKILNIIHRNAADPKTNLPHPVARLENAFKEAKIRIDEKKPAEDQVQEIVKKLMPILPIKLETVEIELHIPSAYAGKMYGVVSSYGKMLKTDWLNDGSLRCVIELPAGLQLEMYEDLNNKTHGGVDSRLLRTK